MRKVVHIAYGVLKHPTSYDPAKAFARTTSTYYLSGAPACLLARVVDRAGVQEAASGRSSHSPARIAAQPCIVSASETYVPGRPVNGWRPGRTA